MGIHSHIQLPNLILQQFRDNSDPEKKVWYLDIASGKILRKPAGRLGTAKNYYSKRGEEFWSKNIESPLGKLGGRVRAFCNGEAETITIADEDRLLAKHYIKAAAVRSNLAYQSMKENSITANLFSEQANHDAFPFWACRLLLNLIGSLKIWQ